MLIMKQAMPIGSIREISVPYPQVRCGFPGGSTVKNLPADEGNAGSIPGS